MKWTKEQEKAIYTKNSNIIVSAGAGSGKTAVLTARTIDNLNYFDIDKMIILTFTKAAAFSMKNKIKKALSKSDEKIKKNLKLLDQASICTFDSFSLDLVKKYSYLLNIDPDISIADEVIIESSKEKIIDEVFFEFYEDEKFLEFLDIYTVKDDNGIKKDIKGILNNLDKLNNPINYLNTYFDTFNQAKYEEFIDKYKLILSQKYELLKIKYEELKHLVTNEKESEFINSLDSFMHFEEFKEFYLFQNFNLVYRLRNNEDFKEKYNEIKAIIKEIQDLAIYQSEDEIKLELNEAFKYSKTIIELVKTIYVRFIDYKKEHNLYEFNDITRLAIKIFEENEDIRDYYKNNIKEIMIDEYQDTNDVQDYFVSLIENSNVFMVGDVKQSIYRFRNANPKIFIKKYNSYSNNNGGIKVDLSSNFRSRKEVVDIINLIFSKIMTENIGGAEYMRDHMMIFGQIAYEEDASHNLKILNYDETNYEGFKESEIEAFIIARDIKEKYENKYQVFDTETKEFHDFNYSDAAILLSTKKEFELYKKVFTYFDIPLTVHKDEDLTYATELIVIKNIIKLVGYYKGINLDNKLLKTYMSVSRSFVLNNSDKDIFKVINSSKNGSLFDYIDDTLKEKIVYLSEFIDNHSISEFLIEIINIFDIYLKLGTIGDNKLISYKIDHLINIALSLEKEDYHLEEFIAYLNDASEEDINFSLSSNKSMDLGVNLMTIHKSKGLDFKVCYFADLNKKFSIREIKSRFLFTPEYGFIIPVINEGIKSTILKELLKGEYLSEEISERIRLLYVALTRAKEDIIFVTNLKGDIYESSLNDEVKLHYTSFKDIIESVKYYLKDYIVDSPKIDINHEYEMVKLKENKNEATDFETIDINIEKIKLEETKFSHSVTELRDNSLLESGTKIHEYLEYLDFNSFDDSLNKLNANEFFKGKIANLKNMPFIKENAIYHKEYEFIYNSEHGIIDLLIETGDKLIVVDYKLSEINKDYYFDQVRGYMNYLRTISDKKIEGYLYSIMDGTYLEIS